MTRPARFWFHSISYRRGFVEVTPGIHPNSVNMETFQIESTANVEGAQWVSDSQIKDEDVVANTELELTPDEAESLGRALIAAADEAKAR